MRECEWHACSGRKKCRFFFLLLYSTMEYLLGLVLLLVVVAKMNGRGAGPAERTSPCFELRHVRHVSIVSSISKSGSRGSSDRLFDVSIVSMEVRKSDRLFDGSQEVGS